MVRMRNQPCLTTPDQWYLGSSVVTLFSDPRFSAPLRLRGELSPFRSPDYPITRDHPIPISGEPLCPIANGLALSAISCQSFPSSISRSSPLSATGIPSDAPACTPARDGALHAPPCSTAFPGQPARAEPSRLCETSSRRPPPPSASASISAQPAALSASPARACFGVQRERLSCRGTFRCGAVSLIHLVRTLCMCVKIAAIVRTLPGGLALHAAGSRCSIKDLVHPIVHGKHLDRGSPKLSVNLFSRCGMLTNGVFTSDVFDECRLDACPWLPIPRPMILPGLCNVPLLFR